MTWRDQAACLGEDPERFFPIGAAGRALEQIERAKAVCRDCQVAADCLEWALERNEEAGVWGGAARPRTNGARCAAAGAGSRADLTGPHKREGLR